MKVVHVNTNDRGGAATAIIRIHEALLSLGVDSHILFLNSTGKSIPNSHYFKGVRKTFWHRVRNRITGNSRVSDKQIREKYPEIEWFSDPVTLHDINSHPLVRSADIVQLNWVSGFVDEPSFFKNVRVPVVWRMPDLYATGGGFHYKKGFPFEELTNRLDKNTKIRNQALQGANVSFVAISEWVKSEARTSEIIGSFPIQVIHNGLDFTKIPLVDRAMARSEFDFAVDKKIVLLGADRVNSQRKGLRQAMEAITAMQDASIQVVVFGNYKGEAGEGLIQMGYMETDDLFRLYAAADLFLMPSLEEAFGQVFIESLAMGTPVVAFPNGGAADVLLQNKNGVIAESFETIELTNALRHALETDFDREWIRNDIRNRFDIKDKAKEYLKLYNELNT